MPLSPAYLMGNRVFSDGTNNPGPHLMCPGPGESQQRISMIGEWMQLPAITVDDDREGAEAPVITTV